jgi:formate hydrogenlyase subunit 3/multisubunit Na+/H+ antiporter MnhD subunit
MDRLVLPILVPGAAGILAMLLPRRLRALRSAVGLLGTLGALLTGVVLLGARESVAYGGILLGPLDLDLAFRADGFSSWAAAFVGLMGFLTSLYSFGWFRGRGGAPGRYDAYVLLATAGAAGAVLADNQLLLVIFWDLVSLMLFLLVATGREDGAPAAAKTFTILGLGDMALLLAVVLIGLAGAAAGLARPLARTTLAAHPLVATGAGTVIVFLLVFAAAAAKAGAVPLHSWIPTMAGSTHAPVLAFLPGALDKVLGIYLLARASVDWFVLGPGLRFAVMAVGAVTILTAVLMAMVQHELRRLLSFHAVSQVGYMVLGIGTGTLVGVLGGVFHMLNNAIYKSCLFLGAGIVERQAGTGRLDRLGGLGKTMPVTFGAMLVAALAISGVPPLNGFVSKWLVYQGCVAAGQPLFLVAALFGSVLTLASFVKVLHSIFWGARPARLEGVREEGIALRLPLVTLAALCVLLGIFAAVPLDRAIGPVVGLEPDGAVPGSAALDGAASTWGPVRGPLPLEPGPSRAAFGPLAVTGLLVLGVLAGLVLAHLGRMGERRVRSVFIGGEPIDPERNTFPGTEFYRTVSEARGLGPALRAGDRGTFDVYRIGGSLGGLVIAVLRRLHSGAITDYLFWCFLGVSVVLGVLFWG